MSAKRFFLCCHWLLYMLFVTHPPHFPITFRLPCSLWRFWKLSSLKWIYFTLCSLFSCIFKYFEKTSFILIQSCKLSCNFFFQRNWCIRSFHQTMQLFTLLYCLHKKAHQVYFFSLFQKLFELHFVKCTKVVSFHKSYLVIKGHDYIFIDINLNENPYRKNLNTWWW